jgi:predicted transcriptional regulator
MNCNCHDKCHLLGGLEQKIMEILWESKEPLKPSDVLKKMTGDYAYTTIMTVLKRMADKKLVTRKAVGNAFVYSPIKDKNTFACTCLDDLFTRLFASYGNAVTVSFRKASKRYDQSRHF